MANLKGWLTKNPVDLRFQDNGQVNSDEGRLRKGEDLDGAFEMESGWVHPPPQLPVM